LHDHKRIVSFVVHDVVVGIEHHRHVGAQAHVVDLGRAVRVFVVFQAQAQAQADRVGQGAIQIRGQSTFHDKVFRSSAASCCHWQGGRVSGVSATRPGQI